ncbi:flagellar biosynthesis anti-sigma factor FlgM [Gilvimarinus polysaccharolyticus]|uniref:flagellar biosynthesis anti-sigma factor FlgM n=1 Tax=Gilvimarinus polysaccharolyticus TaxID=863921 RepID=UPI0006733C37|nr:flagellar biosynthesis anti-sigma factor FlgM [Gilvimarinus polysaccharolyticus]
MVIDTSNTVKTNTANSGRTTATAGNARADKTSPQAQGQASSGADSVALSPEAQTISHLREAIDNASGVDSERVNSIKLAIAEGRFEINPERLAQAMLAQDDLLS